MAPSLWYLVETYLTQQLLRTPAFHRAVEKVAKYEHRIRHGLPPEELGGTRLEGEDKSGLAQHFIDEIKKQLDGKTTDIRIDDKAVEQMAHDVEEKLDAEAAWRKVSAKMSTEEKKEAVRESVESLDAETAWKDVKGRASEPPKQGGILGAYVDAIREQMRGPRK